MQSISASVEAVCRKTLQNGKVAFDHEGRTIWIADAHRGGKRFIVRADERLTAFMELEPAIRACRDTTVFKAGRALPTKIIEIIIDTETVCYSSSEAAR